MVLTTKAPADWRFGLARSCRTRVSLSERWEESGTAPPFFVRFGFLPLELLFLFFQMPPASFFRGYRGCGEKEHRIEDGQCEGQRKKRSEKVTGYIPFGVEPQKEADGSEHCQQQAVPERRRGENDPCLRRWLPGGGRLRLAAGERSFQIAFARIVCKLDYDKKQIQEDKECGNELRRVPFGDIIGEYPHGDTYVKPP